MHGGGSGCCTEATTAVMAMLKRFNAEPRCEGTTGDICGEEPTERCEGCSAVICNGHGAHDPEGIVFCKACFLGRK
jgi:hypothetical protein